MTKIIKSHLVIVFMVLITFYSCSNDDDLLPASPEITSISPDSGPFGTEVTITGTNLGTSIEGIEVSFNGEKGVVTAVSMTEITVTAPEGGTTGQLVITSAVGSAKSSVFTYVEPAQMSEITSISPDSGFSGTVVTITGTNLGITVEGTEVSFNGKKGVITAVSLTEITATAPEGGTTGELMITNELGSVKGPVFTYKEGPPSVPVVTNIEPMQGEPGTTITVTGSNFGTELSDISVHFNALKAEIKTISDTQIEVIVPEDATTGEVSVTTKEGTGTGPIFTVIGGRKPDVYIAGSVVYTSTTAVYWKNGVETRLSRSGSGDGNYGAIAIAISGDDVHVVGWEYDRVKKKLIGLYWKNGIVTTFEHESLNTGLVDIVVKGKDVHILGRTNKNSFERGITYWKNGVPTVITDPLTEPSSTPNSMIVVDNDVYITGHQSKERSLILGIGDVTPQAKYWKNGVAVNLSDGTKFADANAIVVIGDDVYVAGDEQSSPELGTPIHAKIWKNGVPSIIPTKDNARVTNMSVSNGNIYFTVREAISTPGNIVFKNSLYKNYALVKEVELGGPMAVENDDVHIVGSVEKGGRLIASYLNNGVITDLSWRSSEAQDILVK